MPSGPATTITVYRPERGRGAWLGRVAIEWPYNDLERARAYQRARYLAQQADLTHAEFDFHDTEGRLIRTTRIPLG